LNLGGEAEEGGLLCWKVYVLGTGVGGVGAHVVGRESGAGGGTLGPEGSSGIDGMIMTENKNDESTIDRTEFISIFLI
jgi:hypothetical protein